MNRFDARAMLGAAAAVALTGWAVTAFAAQPTEDKPATAPPQAAVAPPTATAPAAAPPAADAAAGKALMETACSNCHELGIVTSQRKSREEWNTTVNEMISHGAAITDDQANQVVDYLAKNYGPGSK